MRQARKRHAAVRAAGVAAGVAAASLWAGTALAASYTITSQADFGAGTYASTNSTEPPVGHVKLNSSILTPYNFIWVAASGRGTAIRIDTNTGVVQGEYYTAPNGMARNPSRTTVDVNGDVWVGNRDEAGGGLGSVVKISRSATGAATSTGVWNGSTFDARNWSNAGGADSNGGTSTASDPAIMRYVRTTGTNARSLAIDANNNLWVGGLGNTAHQLYDGSTGAPIAGAGNSFNVGGGGYGAVIDGNGVLWSAGFSNLVRHDPATNTTSFVSNGRIAYGLGVDTNGKVWVSNWTDNSVQRLNPTTGAVEATFNAGASGMRGVAVTPGDNDIWVAASYSNQVVRFNNDGTVQAHINVGDHPTGVAVDANGKVWVTNYNSSTVMRIDPATSAVDLTVNLGSGANPYNYSDMTGSVLAGTTIGSGTWRRVLSGGGEDAQWNEIFWNTEAEASIPAGTTLVMEARVSNDGVTWSPYVAYASGDSLGLVGKYLELRATFGRGAGQGDATAILSDVRIEYVPDTVPEPMSLALFGLGLAGLGLVRRRRAA